MLTLAAFALLALVPIIRAARRKAESGEPETLFANIAEGVHQEFFSRLPDVALGSYFLLAKAGSDADHAALCGAADVPIGIYQDTTLGQFGATQLDMPLSIKALGAGAFTAKVAINSTVALGDLLVPAASGYARTLPAAGATPATYYVIGRALRGGAAGDVIEIDPTLAIVTQLPASGSFTPTAAAVVTTAATNSSPYGFSQAQANAIVASINAAVVDIAAIKTTLGI